jgi:hypothetical protein
MVFEFFIILLTTFIATILSSMSGGGASVINIPVFLSLGIPFPLAMLMQKISSAFWVLPAAYNYLKGKAIDWVFIVLFSFIGLLGCYFGIIFVLSLNQRTFEIIIGTIIIILVLQTYFQKDLGIKEVVIKSKIRNLLVYPAALILGFYESLFGSGNGIMLAIVSFYTKGFDFVKALGYYYAVAFPWVVFTAILLIGKGYFNIDLIIPAVIGSVAGGYLGSKYARYKGNRFIKIVFVIFGGVLGVKLLLGI